MRKGINPLNLEKGKILGDEKIPRDITRLASEPEEGNDIKGQLHRKQNLYDLKQLASQLLGSKNFNNGSSNSVQSDNSDGEKKVSK